jgi:putative membrane protein
MYKRLKLRITLGSLAATHLAVGLVALGAATAGAADAPLGKTDLAFVNKAAQGGELEVAAGKLAAQRAMAPAIKEFGKQMVDDHTAANQQLKSLADAKQIPLQTTLSSEQSAVLGKLETLIGTDFDKIYSQLMVKDHVEDVTEFETELRKGQDAEVKAYASSVLPTLRHHLAEANRLSSQAQKSP